MNQLAVISSFLGEQRNRYMSYKPEQDLAAKFALACQIEGLGGLELCYPADFTDPELLKKLLADTGLGVSAVNIRSRRTGKWLRGSFTSQNPAERAEVVADFKRAIDLTLEIGVRRITTCPLNDGHDYVFEMNYLDAYRFAEETFDQICAHQPDVKVCIEYKWNDPRARCLLASAGESAAFCQSVGAPNLGVTLDIGHALLAGERPAQSVALLSRAQRLFYVHLNDNDRNWDWDMIPGAFHFWESIEFLYYLNEIGYRDDWYAYDVFSKEIDTVETFNTVVTLTRRLEEMAGRIDRTEMEQLLQQRNPARSLRYLYDKVLK